MTDFFTRCFRNASRRLGWGLLAVLLLAAPVLATAEGIAVRGAELAAAEEGYFLEADFEIALNPTLEDALNKGVPLYFVLDFEIIRPRWYWLDEKVFATQQQYRLA